MKRFPRLVLYSMPICKGASGEKNMGDLAFLFDVKYEVGSADTCNVSREMNTPTFSVCANKAY